MTDEIKGDEPSKTIKDSEAGNKSASDDLVERARLQREGLEKENERLEKNIKELRELEAARLLGSTAGKHIETQMSPEEKQNFKAQQLANEISNAFK